MTGVRISLVGLAELVADRMARKTLFSGGPAADLWSQRVRELAMWAFGCTCAPVAEYSGSISPPDTSPDRDRCPLHRADATDSVTMGEVYDRIVRFDGAGDAWLRSVDTVELPRELPSEPPASQPDADAGRHYAPTRQSRPTPHKRGGGR